MEAEKFYSVFLDQPILQNKESVVYEVGNTRVFFVLPEGWEFEKTDKDKSGLNHIAFGVRTFEELRSFETVFNEASIKHTGIKTDKHGKKEYIWFDDPSDIRVEIYCRPLE